jgi:regulator of nonsense transcripts 1
MDKEEKKLLKSVDVVCMTCTTSARATVRKFAFHSILIDETSQITEPLTLLPITLRNVRQCVLVGDHKQLGPTVFYRSQASSLENDLSISCFERLTSVLKPCLVLD